MCHSPVRFFLLLLSPESEKGVPSSALGNNIRRHPTQRELSGEVFTNCRSATGGNNGGYPGSGYTQQQEDSLSH